MTLAAPWVSRRWKRVLWGGVLCLVVLRLLASTGPALDLVLALGVGTVVGSLILLVFGSPSSRPRPEELLDALRDAGIEVRVVRPPTPRGTALRYEVTDVVGDEHAMVLRTPDERDSELLARLYRGLRFRASEVGATYRTLKHRIEHEALMLSLAERAGVRAPRVERIGTTSGGSAFLITPSTPTRAIAEADLRSAGFLEDLWRQVRSLHSAGVAHRHLALETIRVDAAGRPWFSDFDGADTAPSERERARDVAELLTETGRVIGPDAAVDVAVEAMGADQVGPALRMLQPLALPPATRARAKASGTLLEDLRTAVAARTGAPELELEELERIKPRTVLVIAASTLAFYSLLPQLANLEDTADAFTHAEPAWLARAAGGIGRHLPVRGRVLPGRGRRAGAVPTEPAGPGGGVVHGTGGPGGGRPIRAGRPLPRAGRCGGQRSGRLGGREHRRRLHGPPLDHGALLRVDGHRQRRGVLAARHGTVLLILAVLLTALGIAAALRPVRRGVLAPAWGSVRTGASQIGRVFQSPARVAALFGGSIGTTLTYVAAVAFTIRAFGGELTLPQTGAAYLGAVVIATVAPTPGGLGAFESALIAGLTGFGLPAGIAVSATLTFRLATFWLPILPGWFAFGWMQRNQELSGDTRRGPGGGLGCDHPPPPGPSLLGCRGR